LGYITTGYKINSKILQLQDSRAKTSSYFTYCSCGEGEGESPTIPPPRGDLPDFTKPQSLPALPARRTVSHCQVENTCASDYPIHGMARTIDKLWVDMPLLFSLQRPPYKNRVRRLSWRTLLTVHIKHVLFQLSVQLLGSCILCRDIT
jgi:hypothetical protein